VASIVDRPKNSNQSDLLEIEKYTKGLTKYIQTCSTPMTIGIQGEWGSGKTSLLYTLQEELCLKEGSKFHSIWINTWEYSLLTKPDETILKIVLGMIEQISHIQSSASTNETIKKLVTVSKYLLDKAVHAGGTIGIVADVASDAVDGFNSIKTNNSIKELRDTLQQAIDKTLQNSEMEAFIFFIDDLDRLEPSVAVSILELTKNLFDIHNCVFVLAIDYSVVVKGLKSKFGDMTEQNEWEFRAFFDKIIQLPFSMPMSDYNISKYLQNLLADVEYFDAKALSDNTLIGKIAEIVGLSIGTNPRSLKRLANSVSLIDIIRNENDISTEDKIIEFALICLQIAYPSIYTAIQQEPDFTNWNNRMVQSIVKSNTFDLSDIESLVSLEEFDEVWEQTLWKMCQVNTYLRDRIFLISRLLNFIRNKIIKRPDESLGDAIDRLLKMSSVTNVSTITQVSKQLKTNGIYYFNAGIDEKRCWEDYVKFNFVAAGHGERWANGMKKFNVGDIIVVYYKGSGFVGVGRVKTKAVPSYQFIYDGQLLSDEMLTGKGLLERHDNPDDGEWLVEVQWIKTVTSDQGKFKSNSGLFTTPQLRASLDNQPKTIEYINEEFGVDLYELLAIP
jgi:hypothetical protein